MALQSMKIAPWHSEISFPTCLLALLLAGVACAAPRGHLRPFPDRPAAWSEHDDADVPRPPRPIGLEDEDVTRLFRNLVAREADRVLSFEPPRAAEDVNALDEVPCSTWYCPRNHLRAMDADTLTAGPAGTSPPQFPLTISAGKVRGAAPGFVARDARGRKYLIKPDPAGHASLASGAEVVGNLLFHAAGYHVPGAFAVDLSRSDLRLRPDARVYLSGVEERPFTGAALAQMFDLAARTPDGRIHAIAIPWISGQGLGGFDFMGRRTDDPNDRIPHQHRRSLRATYLFFGWLNVTDPGQRNSLDSYVEEGGRRFVRHYLLDFGTALGAGTIRIKGPAEGREYPIEFGRMLRAAVTLGGYQRDWQDDAGSWRASSGADPEVGWFHPLAGWRPEDFHPGDKLPAHLRMTERDGYWAAKVITAFTDDQIAAVVRIAGYTPAAAAAIARAIEERRDRIGERYLRAYAAVESPATSGRGDGQTLCFEDIAIARGYARREAVRYTISIADGDMALRRRWQMAPAGPRTCLPLPPDPRSTYQVVTVAAHLDGRPARPTSMHLRWRAGDDRFVVVGIDRAD